LNRKQNHLHLKSKPSIGLALSEIGLGLSGSQQFLMAQLKRFQTPEKCTKLHVYTLHPTKELLEEIELCKATLHESMNNESLKGVHLCYMETHDDLVIPQLKTQNILIRTPKIQEFTIGRMVKKGKLSVQISTDDLSPSFEKRVEEFLHDVLPNEIGESVENLANLQQKLKGDVALRVGKLNKMTKILIEKHDRKWHEIDTKKVLLSVLGVISTMIAGHVLFTVIPPPTILDTAVSLFNELDINFLYFMLGGFIAQMIDGALGMAYGVSATTFLLSFGISPAVASMSVHASEIFTSGVSGLMHLKFGNVHSKLFKAIVLPGVLGAIVGAYLLTEFENYSHYIKPIVGTYTLFLGILIIVKVLRKNQKRKTVKHAGILATVGGFLDSIGGGGWGPVVSSTLIASGKNPRLVVGSVNLAEFFVSLASSFTFLTILGTGHWQTILGLILGGVCAAPIAANLSRKLNIKAMMLLVGIVVIIVSLRIIIITLIG
jgi:uncharacterized protein